MEKKTPDSLTFDDYYRIEQIFIPHLRKRRDEIHGHLGNPRNLPEGTVGQFVHYTSAEAALQIIRQKRIWLRNAQCMTDFREVNHGFDLLKAYFDKDGNLNRLYAELDKCSPGIAAEAVGAFNSWLETFRAETYIASLSEHDATTENLHGRLSMWRAFGGSGARVAIVLNVPWKSNSPTRLGFYFSPVAYIRTEDIDPLLESVLENIRGEVDYLKSLNPLVLKSSVFTMLRAAITCLKHEGFKEEREWRAIFTPKLLGDSPLMEQSVQTIGGVPQIIYKLPLDAVKDPSIADLDLYQMFDRLIIGPTQYPYAIWKAFTSELNNAGVRDAEKKVYASTIPIRT